MLFRICTNITKTYIWVVYGSGLNETEKTGYPEVNLGKRAFLSADLVTHLAWLGWKAETSKEGNRKEREMQGEAREGTKGRNTHEGPRVCRQEHSQLLVDDCLLQAESARMLEGGEGGFDFGLKKLGPDRVITGFLPGFGVELPHPPLSLGGIVW